MVKITHVQSILFDKHKWTLNQAKKWLEQHWYKQDVDNKPEHYRFRQRIPDQNKYNYKTIQIRPGKMTEIILKKSDVKGKKWKAEIHKPDGKVKTVNFGASGYQDYTQHKDPGRKKLYINRHKKNENWNKLDTPGALSKNILWNKPSLDQSIKATEKKFKVKIKHQ